MQITSVSQAIELGDKIIGCHRVTDEVYHDPKCPGISSTAIRAMLKAPAMYKYGPQKETQNLVRGRAMHCRVLEPKDFVKRFCVKPNPDDHPEALRTVADLKEAAKKLGIKVTGLKKEDLERVICDADPGAKDLLWENFCAKFIQGKEVLALHEMEKVNAVADKINSLEFAQILLSGHREYAFFWRDPKTGILCKCKPDNIHPTAGLLVDLKKSKDASPEGAIQAVYRYGYHIQGAFYVDGVVESLKQAVEPPTIKFKEPDAFSLLMIEEEAPYLHGYYDLEQAFFDEARKLYRKALRDIDFYEGRPGAWPSYCPIEEGRERITTLKTRAYMYKDDE